MEFLKTCTTNAHAIGDFEAVAYQAFSVTRTLRPRNGTTPPDDTAAVEAELRQAQHLVAQDATRPWLWLFRSAAATPDKPTQSPPDVPDPPDVQGYHLQRKHAGSLRASDLARSPIPIRAASTSLSSAAPGQHKGAQGGGARNTNANNQANAADQQQPPDCFTVYELFTSSIIALLSFNLVRDCSVVALNYRTFVAKPATQADPSHIDVDSPADVHWLTSISVYWGSSGTLVISTFTEQNREIRCLDDISSDADYTRLIGKCVRVAPSGLLAHVTSFDDPLDTVTEDTGQRPKKKRARLGATEQSIEKWKSCVKRWLAWKGYLLPDLQKKSSWVRMRIAQSAVSSVASPLFDREMLWPRALCYYYDTELSGPANVDSNTYPALECSNRTLQWFETTDSVGFKDPLDVAQEWFLGRPERDKILEARRKSKKAEEDANRRKDECPGLYPSSPLNTRSGTYGDLQAVSGVYPTPPDGILPGAGPSTHNTPSVSGAASNVILVPGGTNPAISLLAPQEDFHVDAPQHPLTSPTLPTTADNLNISAGDDDLFGDMDEDGYVGHGVNDEDFDFFDEPDGEDVDMLDAPMLEDSKMAANDTSEQHAAAHVVLDPRVKEDMSDPLAALENALDEASNSAHEQVHDAKLEHTFAVPSSPVKRPLEVALPQQMQSPNGSKTPVFKEPTPPLSPTAIAKALLPSPPGKRVAPTLQEQATNRHRDGAFDPLNFSRKMSLSDAKYQDGRFTAHRENNVDDDLQVERRLSRAKSLRDLPMLTTLRYAIGVVSANRLPEEMPVVPTAYDDSDSSSDTSEVSEDDIDEELPAEPLSILGSLVMTAKRKLPTDGNATPLSTMSFAESLGGDFPNYYNLQLDEASLACFEPSSSDWSLVNLPSPVERLLTGARYNMPSFAPLIAQWPGTPTSQPDVTMDTTDEKPLSGKDNIAITQIVTDQIISATLDVLEEDSTWAPISNPRPSSETRWHDAINKIFPKATECSVLTLATIHEILPGYPAQAKAQQRLPPRNSNEGVTVSGNQMFQIHPPFIRVRRAEMHWELLPPAIAFWEPLGLAPVNEPKNVIAFCVYPHSDSLRPCLENFLLNVQLAYDSCKLGSHSRVVTIAEYDGGLVPCRIPTATTSRDAFKALRETCVQLGKLLAMNYAHIRAQQDSKIDAFVIYMVDPFGNPSALWDLCSAFWTLFQTYGQGPPGRPDQPQKPDLVLQVIPMKCIASFDAPVILDASTYVNLAREVYDRCPPSVPNGDKTPLNIHKAPAFQLEETIPRQVPFKLISEPPHDLLRENSYMHVGYAVSLDGTWITAAWTDNCGKSQAVVTYHLGTRVFSEIAKEIWQTTIEILRCRRVSWRCCIAKCGVMERDELEAWIQIISCPTQVNLFLTLLTVDTDSPIKLTPTMPSSTTAQPSANTPGSTPQASISPDPSQGFTPVATPSADTATDPSTDPEARLIDTTDESWGIILAHRLHNSHSTTQFSPALISGLLIKRGETHATASSPLHTTPGPIVVGVNILWIGSVNSTRNLPVGADGTINAAPERINNWLMWTPTVQTRTTAESLLKEVLSQFRGLGLLARLRGMRGTRHGTVPWHIAAAKRGVGGLGRVGGGL
ncbi:hypothetical protein P153DRAFT_351481 [Dothidotthia symphoricarpi CBS 119687]|uniref:Mediator of RNA polymerase II transcription subunit 13 n=1 Tax=Dothidotthia symphoricarpi CBS 119687 TaxID=1392245 RepID=A0A6A5ZWM1_9PLEO|nr:uncharacterized protein P153DRAFT_351481 [Dothidotthia symphoricarpi CBS 119687]KAF2123929.1 hypothetical protein P153DRAFT_351481 [Dothidotthia symphoricarpi CBS 119687]